MIFLPNIFAIIPDKTVNIAANMNKADPNNPLLSELSQYSSKSSEIDDTDSSEITTGFC